MPSRSALLRAALPPQLAFSSLSGCQACSVEMTGLDAGEDRMHSAVPSTNMERNFPGTTASYNTNIPRPQTVERQDCLCQSALWMVGPSSRIPHRVAWPDTKLHRNLQRTAQSDLYEGDARTYRVATASHPTIWLFPTRPVS